MEACSNPKALLDNSQPRQVLAASSSRRSRKPAVCLVDNNSKWECSSLNRQFKGYLGNLQQHLGVFLEPKLNSSHNKHSRLLEAQCSQTKCREVDCLDNSL